MTEETLEHPVKVAFIIDNKVVDVIHTDTRLGAIFLSNPTTIDITEMSPMPAVGWDYDSATNSLSGQFVNGDEDEILA